MELHYELTGQDFADFNLHYFDNSSAVQRSILIARISTAAIVIIGGTILMTLLGSLSLIPLAGYLAVAALFFFGIPFYMRRRVAKNALRIVREAENKHLCGQKTFILHENEFELKGEGERTSYPYNTVQRILSDENHFYIFIGEKSGVIVPFSAFKDKDQRTDFYGRMTAHMHTPEAVQ